MNNHNLQPLGSEIMTDIHETGKNNNYTYINSIKIGNLDFSKTLTAVIDFNKTKELAALNIQGIIGANLMRQAIWDIDFPNKTITITDSEDTLEIPENYDEAKFFIGYTGTPSITSKVNGMRVLNNNIDTGFNGSIKFTKKEFMKLRKKGKIDKYITLQGTSVGIYGAGTNQNSYYGLVDEINYGKLKVNPSVVSFEASHSKLIGMEFLNNYRVIFNWNTRRIKFIEVTPYKNDSYYTYGFSFGLDNTKIVVRSITKESDAYTKGVQLGDQIVAIDNRDCNDVSLSQWNEVVKDFTSSKKKSIAITIKRGSMLHELTINKKMLLKNNSSES